MMSNWHPGPDDPDRWNDDRDGRDNGTGDSGGREALTVLLVVLIGGGALITVSNTVLHFGHTIGVVLFSVLPIVAALLAATRLHEH